MSRIGSGRRRTALDQLAVIARVLGTTLDQLVESPDDGDVVIRPRRDVVRGATTWLLPSPDRAPHGVSVAKMRITEPTSPRDRDELRVHPGRDWFTVLSGTARLQLGERVILVQAGEAAAFSCMSPHAITAHRGPGGILALPAPDRDRGHIQP